MRNYSRIEMTLKGGLLKENKIERNMFCLGNVLVRGKMIKKDTLKRGYSRDF